MTTDHEVRTKLLALLVIGAAASLSGYDLASMAVAMASIRNSLSFTPAEVPWINSAYSLAFGGFLLLGGRLGDIYGRKRIIVSGAAVSVTFSILCALSASPLLFIFAQICKGVGIALLLPNIYALINNLFGEGKERHKALAVFAFCGEGGYAGGNFFGGVLSDYSWRMVFVPSIFCGLCVAVFAIQCLPRSEGVKPAGKLDLLGALLSSLGFAATILSITNCLELGIRSPVTLSLIVAAVALVGAFAWRMGHHPSPLVPPELLRNRFVLGAGGVIFFLMGGGMGVFVQLVLYMQDVLGYSPAALGTALIPFVIMTLTSSYLIDRYLNHLGFRTTIICGLSLLLLCVPFFMGLGAHSGYWLGIFPIMAFYNLGYPLPAYGVRAPAGMGVAAEGQGIAYGVNLALEQFGITFGITTASAMSTAASHGERTPEALVHGFHMSLLLSGAYLLSALLIATFAFARRGTSPIGVVAPAVGAE
jgi:MFS family permease